MIIVASSFPEKYNRNASVSKDLAAGFAQIAGENEVVALDFSAVRPAIEILRPSLVILVGSPAALESNYRDIGLACQTVGACFAFWTVEDPYEIDFNFRFAPFADVIFSNDLAAVPFYDRTDVNHLPLAARASLVKEMVPFEEKSVDFFFCGVGFLNRQVLIKDLIPIVQDYKSLIFGDNWPKYESAVVQNLRLSMRELLGYYSNSRCVLNVGRNFSIANSCNLQAVTPGPRTFEAAAVGCVQIYHRPGPSFQEYFNAGKEMLVFETIAEFGEQFESLMGDSRRADSLAKAAQRRVLAEHTYTHRARTILARTGLTGLATADPAAVSLDPPRGLTSLRDGLPV